MEIGNGTDPRTSRKTDPRDVLEEKIMAWIVLREHRCALTARHCAMRLDIVNTILRMRPFSPWYL